MNCGVEMCTKFTGQSRP